MEQVRVLGARVSLMIRKQKMNACFRARNSKKEEGGTQGFGLLIAGIIDMNDYGGVP